mgnify:CR=1 FL=1
MTERLIANPGERREAVLQLIRSARRRLALSVFRCTDFKILDELAAALERGVEVRLLFTRRAKGWSKRLDLIRSYTESMGVGVRQYAGPESKYHAKYGVADDGPGFVASLNFTHKCLDTTCDFLLLTRDPEVVSGLWKLFEADWGEPGAALPDDIGQRLIVGPENARARLRALFEQARRSIHIVDHKVDDEEFADLLERKRRQGVAIDVVTSVPANLLPHGKMFLIDGETLVVGSASLSRASLDARRELALVVRDQGCVAEAGALFQKGIFQ